MFKGCHSASGKRFACGLRCSSARTNASSRRHKARSRRDPPQRVAAVAIRLSGRAHLGPRLACVVSPRLGRREVSSATVGSSRPGDPRPAATRGRRCRYRGQRAAHLASRAPSWRPAPAGPPASRQPVRRDRSSPRPLSAFGCDRSARPGSAAFGRIRALPVRASPFGPAKGNSGAIGEDSAPLGFSRVRLTRLRARSERTRASSGFFDPLGRTARGLGPVRAGSGSPPDLSGTASGRASTDSAGLGCVLPWDWPAGRKRGPRSSGTIDRLRPRPGKTRDTSGTIGSGSEALDSARGTRSEALGRARRRSAARRKALE